MLTLTCRTAHLKPKLEKIYPDLRVHNSLAICSTLCSLSAYLSAWWGLSRAGQLISSPCRTTCSFQFCLIYITALINLFFMWSSHRLSQAVCVAYVLLPVLSSSSSFRSQRRKKYWKAIFFSQKSCILYTYEKNVSFSSSISCDVFLDCIINSLKIKVHYSNGLQSEQVKTNIKFVR